MDTEEKRIFTFILITSLVLGIIITYFIVLIIRQQRRTLELHRLNILAEISTLEKERARVAADLHDDLGPVLSAIKFKINSVDVPEEEDKELLVNTVKDIDGLIKRIRSIAIDLMPNTSLKKGLIIALGEFAQEVQKNSSLSITLLHSNLPKLTSEININLFRIVQELLHNTVKHSHASKALIQLSTDDNKLLLVYSDNGIGFDFRKQIKQDTGLGLKNLKSRCEIMGGTLTVEAEDIKGINFIFEIPLK